MSVNCSINQYYYYSIFYIFQSDAKAPKVFFRLKKTCAMPIRSSHACCHGLSRTSQLSMQNSGFPTYNNIFHVSFSDFDVQKWRTIVLCCRSDKSCSFLRQFRAPLARKFISIFNFLRNFLDATFCRRNRLK